MRSLILKLSTLSLVLSVAACSGGSSGSSGSGGANSVQTSFQFVNSLDQSVLTNVATSGQSSRKVNLIELTDFMGNTGTQISQNSLDALTPTNNVNILLLELYQDTATNRTRTLSTGPFVNLPNVQTNLNGISPSAKSLSGKTAGNDSSTDHKVWNTPGNFVGWADSTIVVNAFGGIDTPENLIRAFFGKFDQNCADFQNTGNVGMDPDNKLITDPILTPSGLDLRQLVGKFINMAVFYSQLTDDYLDTDPSQPSKGLLANNLVLDGTNPFTSAEHQWDEGWGYFGAARDYRLYTDDEVSGKGGRTNYQIAFDSNNDGMIDLDKEVNLFLATNASKRDRGSDATDPTDFSNTIFDAFINGRKIITAAAGSTYTVQEMNELSTQRDLIRNNIERVIAATIVHYINDVIQDMNDESNPAYFSNLAKHWSEMKGFALGLQFNPGKLISQPNFISMHSMMGDAPVLKNQTTMAKDTYKAALIQIRDTILGTSYGFSQANLGDANGTNGW
jgi:hypothetical protein